MGLKISLRVAGEALIATRYYCACQNSLGFRAIRSQKINLLNSISRSRKTSKIEQTLYQDYPWNYQRFDGRFMFCQKFQGYTSQFEIFYTQKEISSIYSQAKQELNIRVDSNWILVTLYLCAYHLFFYAPDETSFVFTIHPKFKIITKGLFQKLLTRKLLQCGLNSGSKLPLGRRSSLREILVFF